mgnify:FL=1
MAIEIMITAPKIHEIMAAGPAILAADPEPKSHPDPIKEFNASIMAENKPILCMFGFSTLQYPLLFQLNNKFFPIKKVS